MREIKFRVFDPNTYKMIGTNIGLDKNYLYDFEGDNITEQEGLIIMQYTGLKDKNGKEIYEGDILLFNNDYPNAQKMEWKCVVKYLKGSFVCEYPKDGVYNHFDSWNVPKVTWEVIGNIYETPLPLEESYA